MKKHKYKDPPRHDLILKYEGEFRQAYQERLKNLMRKIAKKLKDARNN